MKPESTHPKPATFMFLEYIINSPRTWAMVAIAFALAAFWLAAPPAPDRCKKSIISSFYSILDLTNTKYQQKSLTCRSMVLLPYPPFTLLYPSFNYRTPLQPYRTLASPTVPLPSYRTHRILHRLLQHHGHAGLRRGHAVVVAVRGTCCSGCRGGGGRGCKEVIDRLSNYTCSCFCFLRCPDSSNRSSPPSAILGKPWNKQLRFQICS